MPAKLHNTLLRRVGRHALTALSAMSLVLCVSAIALRVRQHFASEEWGWHIQSGPPTTVSPGWLKSYLLQSDALGLQLLYWRSQVAFQRKANLRWWSTAGGDNKGFKYVLFAGQPATLTRPIFNIRYSTFLPEKLRAVPIFLASGEFRYPQIQSQITWLELPTWLVAFFFAPMPTLRLILFLRERRRLQRSSDGLCVSCGYDLRATTDRCPECGSVANGESSHSNGSAIMGGKPTLR